jgi:methyl-accepting chemotaxis protein
LDSRLRGNDTKNLKTGFFSSLPGRLLKRRVLMKRFFSNFGMLKKMLVGPLVVVLFLIGLSYTAYRGLSEQKAAIIDIFGDRFKAYQESSQILSDLYAVHANLYKLLTWQNTGYQTNKTEALGKAQIVALDRIIERIKKTLETKNLNSDEQKLYREALGLLTEYRKPAADGIDMAGADINAATMFISSAAEDKFQPLQKTLQDLLRLEEGLAKDRYEFALQRFSQTMTLFFLFLVLAIGLSVVINGIIAKMITSPIRGTLDVIQKIAEGDLTREISRFSRDEIGELARAVDAMRVKVSEMVGHSVALSKELSDAASEQAASLEETSSSLEEMSSMIKQSANSVTQADQIMKEANEVMVHSNGSMNQVTTSMQDITKASEETQKIIKNIDEIAFQTNLLALNAAVEAARAGEAGAGFAVVASEVRTLAMRAANAARNTADLIEGSVKRIRTGSEMVKQTSEGFSSVVSKASKVGELMAEIAAASNEQAQGIDQVNRAVAQMNELTQRNAAQAEELAAVMALFKTESGLVSEAPIRKTPARSGGLETRRPHHDSRGRKPEEVLPLDGEDLKDFQ